MTWHTLQHTDRVAVNINDEVSFKLTDYGRQLIVEGRIDGWHDYADPRTDGTMADLSDCDIAVAATVIQWLGSPVGMDFVRTCLEFDTCSACDDWPVRCDEDGCCISCGADAVEAQETESVTGYEIRERIRSRRER